MWRVVATELDGEQHIITTCSLYYAQQRYNNYMVAVKCGLMESAKIETVEDEEDD